MGLFDWLFGEEEAPKPGSAGFQGNLQTVADAEAKNDETLVVPTGGLSPSSGGHGAQPGEAKTIAESPIGSLSNLPVFGGGSTETAPVVQASSQFPTYEEYVAQQLAGAQPIQDKIQGIVDKYYSEGSLGRVDQPLSSEMADILARRKSALEGFSAQENEALRAKMLEEIGRGEQTALRQLRGIQGSSGIRGGLASAQQANILKAADDAKTQAERDLFIQNILQKQNALGSYEQTVGSQSAQDLGIQQFNIGQQGKEVQAGAAGELSGLLTGLTNFSDYQTQQALIPGADSPVAEAAAESPAVTEHAVGTGIKPGAGSQIRTQKNSLIAGGGLTEEQKKKRQDLLKRSRFE